MKRSTKMLLAAVLSALPLAGRPSWVSAQVRTGDDGRVLDASNRLGGFGRYNVNGAPDQRQNPYGTANNYGVNANQVTYGNVTAGKEFRGREPFSDPGAFRGNVPGRGIEDFYKNSAGVPTPYAAPNVNPNAAQPFYGQSRYAPPPPGYVQPLNTPGAVPAPPQVQRQGADPRLGNVIDPANLQVLPRPGDFLMPGPVDPTSNTPTVFTANPFSGVRLSNQSDPADQFYLNNYSNLRNETVANRLHVDARTLQKMRDELLVPGENSAEGPNRGGPINRNANAPNGDNLANPQQRQPGTNEQGPNKLSQGLSDPLIRTKPLDSSLNGAAVGGAPLANSVRTGEMSQNRVLAAAGRQSAKYKEMQAKLEAFYNTKVDPQVIRHVEETYLRNLQKEQEAKAKPGPLSPTPVAPVPAPGGAGQEKPKDPLEAANLEKFGEKAERIRQGSRKTGGIGSVGPTGPTPAPVAVKSFEEGIAAKGLKDTLHKAEDLMKQGKFTAAVDQFDLAQQVAPNNTLIWLGRATAELGGSFYGLAERHLRQAYLSDPALMMGQYDLKTMLGEDRLKFLVDDLKEASKKDEKNATPIFLLAYVAYNTGNERKALGYLDMADKRAQGKDALYRMLKDHWSLPADGASNTPTAPLDLNK